MNIELNQAIEERDYWRTQAGHATAWCWVLGAGLAFAAGIIIASLCGR